MLLGVCMFGCVCAHGNTTWNTNIIHMEFLDSLPAFALFDLPLSLPFNRPITLEDLDYDKAGRTENNEVGHICDK